MSNATSVSFGNGGVFNNALGVGGLSTLIASSGQAITWSGSINDSGPIGTLNLTGGGRFDLTNTANNYSGGTIVAGNTTLGVANDAVLGAGALRLGDAGSGATLAINANGVFNSSRSIVIGGAGAVIDTAGGTDARLNGSISGKRDSQGPESARWCSAEAIRSARRSPSTTERFAAPPRMC